MSGHYLPRVRDQYEDYPYPERSPDDERTRLLQTNLDDLAKLNHYCFNGNLFNIKNINVLVAGGGTGDALIFLAEQLRELGGHVTYVDISTTSMNIAKKRAEIRDLSNVSWIHGSLLELDSNIIGKFDYINCSGVLHHLADPSKGLITLKSLLKPHGCMGIMVYAKYGRTAIYQIQELMRLINDEDLDAESRITNTELILNELPETNWLKRSEELFSDHRRYGAIGIYDLFLHSQDRAYSIPELKDWLEECGLEFIEFAEQKEKYDPAFYLKNSRILESIRNKGRWGKYAISELVSGSIIKHAFYCGLNANTTMSLSDNARLVFKDMGMLRDIVSIMIPKHYGQSYKVIRNNNLVVEIPVNQASAIFFQNIDQKNTFGKIRKKIEKKLHLNPEKRKALLVEYSEILDSLIKHEEVFLSR